MTYKPSKEAKRLPRAIQLDGSWIGVGGEIVRRADPPNINTILQEATAEQYKRLYEMGFHTLIEKHIAPAEVDITSKSKKEKNVV